MKSGLNKDQIRLVDALSKELEEGNLAIFAGAGFSQKAGFVDWKTLLKPIADDLDLNIEKEWDLVTLAQYHTNINQSNRAKLNQLLVTEFSSKVRPTENHRILSRLPIATYWTTNYDSLIETSLDDNGKIADVKYTVKQLATTKPNRDAVIYKMHGDANHPADAVLIRDDYERYHIKMQPFITALSGDLVSKTFLFLGFSFSDPNLEYILSRVRIHYGPDQRQHYCILRCEKCYENEVLADFEYRKRKEQLFSGELLRVGIKTTYVDDFGEITDILKAIENKHKRHTVFISGAAHDYTPWSQNEAEQFVYKLSRDINREKFRVISGFGLGIGSAVISGVLEQTIMDGKRLDSDQLILRPFPQTQSGERPLSELWRDYRQDMLDHAGIAIFLFGNKLVDGKVVESDGMREEFEIAREKCVFIIPLGVTGSISRELWKEVVRDFKEDSYPRGKEIFRLLQELGGDKTTLNRAHEVVIEILKIL
ncbi:SIR2-like protein (plasmid) [Zymomonas mobilis subsp. mobilis ZM4 = ATCC 31821]|uniref:SIR2 family protein n=1 Tax=Zymomonas mobilis TaxID=542 RepID=UPI000782B8C0|nr:SIR2 family protein [Zymomonas mobilis]AVZ26812.1 SIR2-like protein [Zymomonas mobilis subsp. mobilis]AVZ28698.1 SIR2-like protein [Zymomonas mobilis subsp. mobilis]AVZ43144.1 SIR2-like protein [Zymomonas mobilis subsp. mobilis ZM4 = ATCC 31821]UBQ08776.1 SIR2 family protein [Zymomonas mobilis]